MSTSDNIIADLIEDIGTKRSQRLALLDNLTVLDANIDTYDKLIANIDKEARRLITLINDAITPVKQAYEARITAECKSDLAWVKVKQWTQLVSGGAGDGSGVYNATFAKYEVQKDSNTYAYQPYHGIKYYQRPLNRDYGSDIIVEFTGSVGVGNSFITVTDTKGLSSLIKVGDKITDSLDSPVLFSASSLPSVVGFGTTFSIGITSSLVGNISFGSSILAVVSGVLAGISTGMYVERFGIIPDNTQIVGFGSTSVIVSYGTTSGIDTTGTITVSSLILSDNATGISTDETFDIGVGSSLPIINLTASSAGVSTSNQFTVIRFGSTDIDKDFDWQSSPFNPITIGIINSNTLAAGNSSFYNYSGAPNNKTTWDEASSYYDPIAKTQINPEPSIGAGRAEYYTGSLTWPVKVTPIVNPTTKVITGYTRTPAYLGNTVTVTVGLGASTSVSIGYSSRGPSGLDPARAACSTLNSNITAAIDNMNDVKNRYMATIQKLVSASHTLRGVRNQKELFAWSSLQGAASLRQDIAKLEADLAAIDKFDFSQFE
jgi:hypothetical protein